MSHLPSSLQPVSSPYEAKAGAVADEAHFYSEADEVYDHLERVKSHIAKQNDEFDTLMEYFTRNRGHLDIEYRSKTRLGDAAQRPNLGTTDPSWYYLDERGNRIWVRNITLDSAKAMSYGGAGTKSTGAFEETEYADGRHVVVKVPPPKRHHSLPADYRRRCVEAEAEWATRYESGAASLATTRKLDATASARGSRVAAAVSGWNAGPYAAIAAAPTADDAYIEAQKHVASSVRQGAAAAAQQAVFRVPATLEEAEARLAHLRAEEQKLVKRMGLQQATSA